MNKIIFAISVILMLSLTVNTGHAYLHQDGENIVDSTGTPILLKGYGLGGWLVPEGYMLHTPGYGSPTSIRNMIVDLVGESIADQFYERYEQNYVNRMDIELIAQWGFNSIRLPFHYNKLYDEDSGSFLEDGFAVIDSMIVWCGQNNMYLILDMHCAPGGQNAYNISDSDGVEARLWTEPANQVTAIKIWKEIAVRYSDEPVIGGYDLINEPVLPDGYSNADLKDLYVRMADTIRTVDTNHILFIEGNWFATDFGLLTPPFDDNMAYSFHKYWNATDIGTIQYLLILRSQNNVPLWMGESGENSNPWFYETIRLFEQNNIGWCWWTHKKLETTTSPLSAPIGEGFQTLINYWANGGTQPSAGYATAALFQQADNLKIENCDIRPGVVPAMLDDDFGNSARPLKDLIIPGTINAVDYDIGGNGIAYIDTDYKNVSGSPNHDWNHGAQYRNDGVDIERSEDPLGFDYNVGWIITGERLMYTVNVETGGSYQVDFRVASAVGGGVIQLYLDNQPLGGSVSVPNTGGWQNWISRQLDSVIIPSGTHTLMIIFLSGDLNLNTMTFTLLSAGSDDGDASLLNRYSLEQNFPNPFNATTTIKYVIPEKKHVTISIYNSLGEQIALLVDGVKPADEYEITWDATNITSGIYFCRLQSGSFNQTRKLTLIK